MAKLRELLDYFNSLLEREMHDKNQEIAVDKNKLHDLPVEVGFLLHIRTN